MSTGIPTLSADLVRDWAHHARAGLAHARSHIDALNVFPVPDGDTGTNLLLTMESAASSVDAACDEAQATAATAARAMSLGALLGARGNSGVILSQIIRGMVDVVAEAGALALDVERLHRSLRRASDLAYEAVAHPVEGTILTVIRECAETAGRLSREGRADTAAVLEEIVSTAQEVVDRTPGMLDTLRLAGVVDAGGQGLVVVLAGLARAVAGEPVGAHPSEVEATPAIPLPLPAPHGAHSSGAFAWGPAFEVMYLLDAHDESIPGLRENLDRLGDSLVVVGGSGLWNVHVHVDDAGAAVEEGIRIGRPHRIRITALVPSAGVGAARGLVAVAHGPGVAHLLDAAGVAVVSAQPRTQPSTGEFLRSIEGSGATEVMLLPSDRDTLGVAEAAAEQARAQGVRVAVIPTRSVVQTLAAVAVHDPEAGFDDDVVAMTRAAGATRYGAVTVASRAALTTAGACREGDVLGVVDGDIAIIGSDVAEVLTSMLSGMLAVGGELVTVVLGHDAASDMGEMLATWLMRTHPTVELEVIDGGQPLWPVIVGVE